MALIRPLDLINMFRLIALLLAFTISACSIIGSDSPEYQEILVENEAFKTIYVSLVEESVLNLIDPSPIINIATTSYRGIASGTDLEFELDAVENFAIGDNLAILVYAVPDSTDMPLQAHFQSIVKATDDELRSRDGRVAITL